MQKALIGLALLATQQLRAQYVRQEPAFEVASIKPHSGPLRRIFGYSASGPLVRFEGYPLIGLVMEAYNMKNYQISFASSAPHSEQIYYDVIAKAPGENAPGRAEVRLMLRSLLKDRFNLRSHREMKQISVYALVVDRNGPKFKSSASDAPPVGNHRLNGRNQTMALKGAAMDALATNIGNYVSDRPVIDRTGLLGNYDIDFEATPDFISSRGPEPGDISVFTAVREQLGLKLQPERAQVELLVIDHLESPSPN